MVRVLGLRSPRTNASGLVDFAWDKPGDALPFEMIAEVGDPSTAKAELWTNADHNADPSAYRPIEMNVAQVDGKRVTYRAEVPISHVGNYKVTGRIKDGESVVRWASQDGVEDIRFRARDEKHDALNIEEINVGVANYDPVLNKYGTFADLMESGSPATNGKLTLEFLKSEGVNALWLQPPFEIEKWDHRDPVDDAGSPYAVKDYFSIRTELARAADGKTGEDARDAAMAEFKAFIKKCDELGIRVILDVALNHVGHNFQFRDLFIGKDAEGKEVREVRKNDFSQVSINKGQNDSIKKLLARPDVLKYMEYLAPHMYGKYPDPHGAKHVSEIAPGGWFEWPDTKQLNHGRMRCDYTWWDVEETVENTKVLEWLTRILRFWAVDMGVHGFRFDHLTGMPDRFQAESLNLVQADVDAHFPGRSLFVMGEDFHMTNLTRHWLDAGQGGWFNDLVAVRTPAQLQAIVESPWFRDILTMGVHDEERFVRAFGGNRWAATRLACLIQLLGGPTARVMGDEFGEEEQLPFKQYRGVASLRSVGPEPARMAKWIGRAGQVRAKLPALADNNRAWLSPKQDGPDPDILAMGRFPDDPKGTTSLVLANLSNTETRENAFWLGPTLEKRIDPSKKYQVRDLMADAPEALWPEPILGKDLIEKGVFCRLLAYQIQVLAFEPVEPVD